MMPEPEEKSPKPPAAPDRNFCPSCGYAFGGVVEQDDDDFGASSPFSDDDSGEPELSSRGSHDFISALKGRRR